MTPQNLTDYISVYHDFIELELCSKAINSLSKVDYYKHKFYDSKENTHNSFEDDLSVTWSDFPEKHIIESRIWFAIERYVLKDLAKIKSLYCGWEGYSQVRFNRYDVNTQMHKHIDHIHTIFDGTTRGIPTLSVVGTLNDDYEGGEFIMWEDYKIKLKTGSILIFPSIFLYPHRVEPIRAGVRHSFVSWVW